MDGNPDDAAAQVARPTAFLGPRELRDCNSLDALRHGGVARYTSNLFMSSRGEYRNGLDAYPGQDLL
ncbi:MAG: hypothetical protein AMJ70_05445 [Dehalococcoidia bacterium SG8_51_3]|nr:MAG: hypothetical protein AMJ70_05445 [Dehalococcoidia bacterium SG8_51_3]